MENDLKIVSWPSIHEIMSICDVLPRAGIKLSAYTGTRHEAAYTHALVNAWSWPNCHWMRERERKIAWIKNERAEVMQATQRLRFGKNLKSSVQNRSSNSLSIRISIFVIINMHFCSWIFTKVGISIKTIHSGGWTIGFVLLLLFMEKEEEWK